MKYALLVWLLALTACNSTSLNNEPAASAMPKEERRIANEPAASAMPKEERRIVIEPLGISLVLPDHIETCNPVIEADTAVEESGINAEDFTPQGWYVELACDNYKMEIRAVSRDYNCWEYCISPMYDGDPEHAREYALMYPPWKAYPLAISPETTLQVMVMDSHWGYGGESFAIGTYYPLHHKRYDTFRITLTLDATRVEELQNVETDIILEELDKSNTEYIQHVIEKTAPAATLKMVADFERMLQSIKKEI